MRICPHGQPLARVFVRAMAGFISLDENFFIDLLLSRIWSVRSFITFFFLILSKNIFMVTSENGKENARAGM